MPTQNVTDNAVTVIIGQSVRRESEQQFLAWQHDLNEAASRYPGFVAAEVAAPTEAQPDWVVIYRFDAIANLRAWLNSSTRQERLLSSRPPATPSNAPLPCISPVERKDPTATGLSFATL